MEPYSLVQVGLQARMHALDVVLPQGFLHLHSSVTLRGSTQAELGLNKTGEFSSIRQTEG